MPKAVNEAPPVAKDPGRLPPLESGDRLTRDEFERRYDAMPHLKKAELVEGVVYMSSAVKHRGHSKPQGQIVWWLVSYEAATTGTDAGDNGSLRLDLDNMPQPDAFLRLESECGGQSRLGDDGYVEGAPELVAEVAASSASYDLHAKLHVYRRNRVQEYVVWRVLDKEIDWLVLLGGEYQRLAPDAAGIYKSEVFPGLWLDPEALKRKDLARVFAVLQEGLSTSEHAAFVQRLAATRQRGGAER
ncbi:MAG: Uma2 family endonuclease [Planctomycetes bacterium]|nr:Uma2 family endonuclease [Planctomycetota bacterium]